MQENEGFASRSTWGTWWWCSPYKVNCKPLSFSQDYVHGCHCKTWYCAWVWWQDTFEMSQCDKESQTV
jgi:hypothetical protein